METYELIDAARIGRLLDEREETRRTARARTAFALRWQTSGSSSAAPLSAQREALVPKPGLRVDHLMGTGTDGWDARIQSPDTFSNVLLAPLAAGGLASTLSPASSPSSLSVLDDLDRIDEAAFALSTHSPLAQRPPQTKASPFLVPDARTTPPITSISSISAFSSPCAPSLPERVQVHDESLAEAQLLEALPAVETHLPHGMRLRACELRTGVWHDVNSEDMLCAPWVPIVAFDPQPDVRLKEKPECRIS